MNFGSLLRKERKQSGLTQQALAAKCGVSAVYIYRLETNGIEPPARKMVYALARALGADGLTLWKAAFRQRLRRWLNKEGYRRVPDNGIGTLLATLENSDGSRR